MQYHMNQVLLVGSGVMAQDYAKVLAGQGVPFSVIGRGTASAATFTEKTGVAVVTGGLARYLTSEMVLPEAAIVAVGVEQLAQMTILLLKHGIKRILLEKPGGLNPAEIRDVAALARASQAKVFVAYNRRFYAATKAAQEIIAGDDGVTSFNFEFTEWSHVIEPLTTPAIVKENWLLANSTHVIDLAFFLGGTPRQMSSYVAGTLSWHPTAAAFSGAGQTESGALFSYQANWAAPGRWGVEVLTRAHRLIFKPMEQLHIQQLGSVAIIKLDIDDRIDLDFKPGLYRQVETFLSSEPSQYLLSIADQLDRVDNIYARIAVNRPCAERCERASAHDRQSEHDE
jgi:predicted dehydrogenase